MVDHTFQNGKPIETRPTSELAIAHRVLLLRSSVPWRRGIKHRGDEDLPKCLRRRSGGRVGREREGGGVYHFPDFGFPDFGFPDFEMAEYLDLPELSDEEIPPELLEELEREIARNAEANRLAKERELEAKAARER